MKWLARAGLALLGVLVALALVEGTLRLTHPRYRGAASVRWVDDADLGYHRRPHSRFASQHPDTGRPHQVIHNSLGLRMSREPALPPTDGARVHAFFGDSFAENIGLPAPLIFTEALHYLLNRGGAKAEVLNFGVDGYGPDQHLLSFRRFLQTRPGVRLDHVYYLFCANDLRNLFEARLFSLDDDGRLVRRPLRPPTAALRLTRRLYLTYFLLEQGVLTRPGLRRLLQSGAEPAPCEDARGAVMDCAFGRQRKERRARLKVEMKGDTERLMDGTLAETSPSGRLFFAVLRAWRQEVEAQGGAFHIVLLPDNGLRGLGQSLAGHYSLLPLVESFRIGSPDAYQEEEMFFKKDGHWNELANMLAADALSRWITSGHDTPPVLERPPVDPALKPYLAASAPALLPRLFGPPGAAPAPSSRR